LNFKSDKQRKKVMADAVTEKLEIYIHSPETKSLDPYSQRELKETLDYVNDQIFDGAFQSYDWEQIIKNGTVDRELDNLVSGNLKEQVDDFLKQSFGYDDPPKRPTTQAEQIVASLSEPYDSMNDEKLSFLGDRRKIEYDIVKRKVHDYIKFIKQDLRKQLPKEIN